MVEIDDYEVTKPADDPPTAPRGGGGIGPSPLWLLVAVLVVATATVVYMIGVRTRRPVPMAATQGAVPTAPSRPLGTEAPAVDLPPLDESDAAVRELVKQVTSNPRIAAWLAAHGLVLSFNAGLRD